MRSKIKSQRSHLQQRSKPWIKMRSRLTDRFRQLQKAAGVEGPYDLRKYLKASTRRIKIHIQSQFGGRWTWSDYGFEERDESGKITKRGFTIDHIIPCHLFDMKNERHLEVLWSLENLRPEDHLVNLKKWNKVELSVISDELRERVEKLGIRLG